MMTKKLTNSNKFLSINRENLSKKYYQDILAYDLVLKQNYTNIMQLPRLEKLVLNTTSKIYVNDKKYILFTLAALELLSGQKPQLTYARKSVANFKIREDQILGCRVVLRENTMYNFLEKLSKIIFPRQSFFSFFFFIKKKDQNEVSKKKSLLNTTSKSYHENSPKFSALTVGFTNLMSFPELENHYELVENFRGMNVTFVFSNSNQETSLLICSGFQLPIIKN